MTIKQITRKSINELREHAQSFGNDTDGVPVARCELEELLDLAEEALRMRPRVAATVDLAEKTGQGLFANILTGKQRLNPRRRRR